MIETKTISLKINHLDKEEYLGIMEQCRLMYNEYTQWCFDNHTYNKNRCHHATYYEFKENYELHSALIQSVRDMALKDCKRSKLIGVVPVKKSLTISLNVKCFTLRGRQLTLIGRTTRHKEILHIPDYYKEVYDNWKSCGANLLYDKKIKQFWIQITFVKENNILKFPKNINVLGIDRGITNVIATSDGIIVSGKNILKKKNDYAYLKRKLQKKGTRSAKRLLRKVSKKEKRFTRNNNHCVSKKLAQSQHNVFVLENLKEMQKLGNNKSKDFRNKLHKWSYYQLQIFLEYKANTLGKHVVYVNPRNTSKMCSCCGYLDARNRNAENFKCISCGHSQHADVNAAINIKNKYLNRLQQLSTVGARTIEPNETNVHSVSSGNTQMVDNIAIQFLQLLNQ